MWPLEICSVLPTARRSSQSVAAPLLVLRVGAVAGEAAEAAAKPLPATNGRLCSFAAPGASKPLFAPAAFRLENWLQALGVVHPGVGVASDLGRLALCIMTARRLASRVSCALSMLPQMQLHAVFSRSVDTHSAIGPPSSYSARQHAARLSVWQTAGCSAELRT